MIRALVTGASGFVGRNLVRSLAKRGAKITAISRVGSGSPLKGEEHISDIVSTQCLFRESIDWWTRICANVDIVIHSAWFTVPGQYLNDPENINCLSGTLSMAQGCINSGVRRFVGIGTCFEYDLSYGMLSTTTPLKPLSLYASTKASTYMALSHWLPEAGTEFLWCRIFYLYGEGEDQRRLTPYVRSHLAAGKHVKLGSGHHIRDFLDVEKAAELIVDQALGTTTGAVNICSGIPVSIRQHVEHIADEYGRRDLLLFGSRDSQSFDPPCVFGII